MITQKLTHAAEAVAHLVQQFRGKPKIEAFVSLIGRQIQDLENALFSIVSTTDINTVTGTQLDVIGLLVSQPRNGHSDDVYRLFLRARILVNSSRGSVDEIIAILALLIGSNPVISLIEPPDSPTILDTDLDPATFEIDVTSDLPAGVDGVVVSLMALEAKSTGIRGLISFHNAPAFRFDTAGAGFDQGNALASTVGV